MIDDLDREIIGLLRRNARASWRELGDAVGLSANATAERVRRLERAGVISGYTALLDPAASGRRLVALVDVRLSSPGAADRFEALIGRLDEVTDAAHVTGRSDYHLRVACADPAELDALIRLLKTEGGVAETDTRIALRTVVARRG
ncbi:MAG TPA: Lrp/AsnC family transcriptional regulator [Solirubrobacteraceae bacterium]|nr:Lrp/AsnC family transcriptional regulator [Solirubrobacteraceae bacterium]